MYRPPVRQSRHDLPRRKRCEFRLVAGEQDPLSFFFAEAVGHMALTAFPPVNTTTVASKISTPALERGEPNAQQQGQRRARAPFIGHALIEDL